MRHTKTQKICIRLTDKEKKTLDRLTEEGNFASASETTRYLIRYFEDKDLRKMSIQCSRLACYASRDETGEHEEDQN